MNKLLIAAATSLVAFTPMSAQASTRNTVIATTAVMFCSYQMGYLSAEEAARSGAAHLDESGISLEQSDAIMDSPNFTSDVVRAIEIGGGCERLTDGF